MEGKSDDELRDFRKGRGRMEQSSVINHLEVKIEVGEKEREVFRGDCLTFCLRMI